MDCLLLVDLQNDFLPGGALPVPGGDEVIPLANRLQERFELVVATRDWHPPDHVSFAANHAGRQVGEVIDVGGVRQMLWPVHCVRDTPGAAFAAALATGRLAKVVSKAGQASVESYSSFTDVAGRPAGDLDAFLRGRGVERLYLCGLATDYCVKFTALDARRLGYETYVILDACRGVDARPGDVDEALAELAAAGVHCITSDEL